MAKIREKTGKNEVKYHKKIAPALRAGKTGTEIYATGCVFSTGRLPRGENIKNLRGEGGGEGEWSKKAAGSPGKGIPRGGGANPTGNLSRKYVRQLVCLRKTR